LLVQEPADQLIGLLAVVNLLAVVVVVVPVGDRGCLLSSSSQGTTHLLGARWLELDVLAGAPLDERHGVLGHGQPASLDAKPERAAQDRVDVGERARRRRRVLLELRAPLSAPPAEDLGVTGRGRATGSSRSAAPLGHCVDQTAKYRSSSSDMVLP